MDDFGGGAVRGNAALVEEDGAGAEGPGEGGVVGDDELRLRELVEELQQVAAGGGIEVSCGFVED